MEISMSEVAGKISREVDIPVFYLQESAIEHGVIGGSMLSAELHGKNTGEVVLRVLRGEKPLDIGLVEKNNSKDIYDYNVLKKFNISEDLLPKNSEVINKPFSFYEEYKNIIIGTITVFSLLLILVIYLSLNIRKRKQIELDMKLVNKELVNIQKELQFIAYYDDITGLPNKAMFYREMNNKLKR